MPYVIIYGIEDIGEGMMFWIIPVVIEPHDLGPFRVVHILWIVVVLILKFLDSHVAVLLSRLEHFVQFQDA